MITWRRTYSHGMRSNGPLPRYVKLRVAHAPEMPGTFSPPPTVLRKPLGSGPDMHHGTCVTHVPWCMSGSLTRGGGENVPGIPGDCATHNCIYLLRGPKHWLTFSGLFRFQHQIVYKFSFCIKCRNKWMQKTPRELQPCLFTDAGRPRVRMPGRLAETQQHNVWERCVPLQWRHISVKLPQ